MRRRKRVCGREGGEWSESELESKSERESESESESKSESEVKRRKVHGEERKE